MASYLDARLLVVFLAGAFGSAVNSIAGGGTLVTFPALVGVGIPAIVANATNTVALSPGALSSMWGYRGMLAGTRQWIVRLTLPSLLGGATGAVLLLHTSAKSFEHIVPWLVLGATVLFLTQRTVLAWLKRGAPPAVDPELERPHPTPAILVYQFLVGVYGGYFGAGIGILMLAAFGFMGFTHIHRMNGLKNWFALCMNAVAAIIFAFSGIVDWPIAIATSLGAIVGGYGGSRLAQRVPQQRVRQAVVVIGFASGIWLLFTKRG